jgi:hypothetical protein
MKRIHGSEQCAVKLLYAEDDGKQKVKWCCKKCNSGTNNTTNVPPIKKKAETADNQDMSTENNGRKENREKGITNKAGTVDGTKGKGQECIPDEARAVSTGIVAPPTGDINQIINSIEQCNLGINPPDYNATTLPETETDSISMTSDVVVITCNHQGCKGHTQLHFQCKACHERIGCNIQLKDNTRLCTECFSKNLKEYANQAIKNDKNEP